MSSPSSADPAPDNHSLTILLAFLIALATALGAALAPKLLDRLGNPVVVVAVAVPFAGAVIYFRAIRARVSRRLVAQLAGVGAAGVLIGALISAFLLRADQPRPATTPAMPATPVAITIDVPRKTLRCVNKASYCRFVLRGNVTGANPAMRIYAFVFPVEPPGSGWYMQLQPATILDDGTWSQSPAQLGSERTPAHDGDTLRLQAALVRQDASFDGTPLNRLADGEALPALQDIKGAVALSAPVELTLER